MTMRAIRELMDLSGRVVAITGGAGHLGRAFAETAVELGATVALLDVPGRARPAALALGERHLGVDVDLGQPERAGDAIGPVLERCGRLDVLVHCASLVGTTALTGWAVPVEQQTLPAWCKALDVNLSSAFALTQAALPALRAHGNGAVVFVGSIYGVVGPDWRLYEGTDMGNPAAYAATKGALLQLVRWYASTLAPAVRVNAISPGGIYRNTAEPFLSRYVARTPLQRMGTEEDLKGAFAYLASDLSRYVTGQNLLVDGGWTTW